MDSNNSLKIPKKLLDEWYGPNGQLARSGFKDIENDKGLLITWSGSPLPEEMKPITSKTDYSSKLYKESQAEYYRMARQFLYSKRFPSLLDKRIWRRHANGKTITVISEEIGKSRNSIQYRITKMRKAFGV